MVLSDLIKEVDKNVEMAKMLSTTDQRLISTGINKIDEIFGNFGIGELHVLAGRPGCGKTAFSIKLAYQTALNLAKDNNRYAQQIGYRKKIVLFFSCEMESNKIAERFIALHMGNAFRVSAALPAFFSSHPDFLKKYMHARDFFLNGDIPIYISDNCYSIEEIEDRIRWYSNHFEISLIVIDYVQRINVTNNKSKNQFEIVAHVVKTLKNISKIQRNVVFALAQASRAVDAKENRGTKTTSSVELSDVRDSSAIECEADSVSFILPGDNNASDDEEHTNSNDDEFTMVSY
jgi:replicative DNA helicase